MRQKVTRRRRRSVPRFNSQYSRSAAPTLSLGVRIRRLTFMLLAVAVLAAAGFWLLFARVELIGMPSPGLTEVRTDQNLVFLPTFDAAGLMADIRRQHPTEVRDVTLRHEWWQQRLVFKIERRQTRLILRTQGTDYTVDGDGIVTGVAAGEKLGELPLLIDQSNLAVETGEQAIPAQLTEFAAALAVSDLETERLRVIDTTSELYADLADGYTVRFATGTPLALQLENLVRVQQIASEKGEVIEAYVDLRVPFKAYYR